MVKAHAAGALVVTLALLAVTGVARADEADDAYAAADKAEKALDFGPALRGYRRALELRPSGSFAVRARVRSEDLAAHSEGDFVPLAKLERVRRDARAANDPAALEELSKDAAGFPPGRVKTESLLLVAEAFGRRLKMPERSVGPAEAIARDPTVDRVARAQALAIATDDMVAMGQPARAFRLARDLRKISPELAARFEREGSRDRLRVLASVVFAVVVASGVLGAVSLARRGGARKVLDVLRAPVPYLVVAALVFGGASLARYFDESITSRPFFLLGAGVLLVDRSIALLARSRSGRTGRWLALAGGLAGVISAALLALIYSDPMFIESFGL